MLFRKFLYMLCYLYCFVNVLHVGLVDDDYQYPVRRYHHGRFNCFTSFIQIKKQTLGAHRFQFPSEEGNKNIFVCVSQIIVPPMPILSQELVN